ncbi:MAG: threonine synthase [Candidatus Thermoplasmatota archaeon]
MKYKLECKKCKKEYGENEKIYNCICGGKLEVIMNISIDVNDMMKREKKCLIEKYFELLPIIEKKNIVTLGEGNTKLIRAERLGEKIGLKKLYLKNETTNPTGSFKDRCMSVGISKALEFEAKKVATASSGNAAISLAAFSAKAGLECTAFVPSTSPKEKIIQLKVYGADVRLVKQRYGKGDRTVKELKNFCKKEKVVPIPSFGSINPYQIEGCKTIGYEIAEEILPENVFIPVGSGALLVGNYKGFNEFYQLGLIDAIPKLIGVQASGCAPLVKAYKVGKIELWKKPKTIANGLADPYPWDGLEAIEALKKTKGSAIDVSDKEIMSSLKLLARYEGIFAEPSGAASLAGVVRAIRNGMIDNKETVVCEITGNGLKDLGVLR